MDRQPQIVQHNTIAGVMALEDAPYEITVARMTQLVRYGLGTLETSDGKVVGELTVSEGVAYLSDVNGITTKLKDQAAENAKAYFFQGIQDFKPDVTLEDFHVKAPANVPLDKQDSMIRGMLSDLFKQGVEDTAKPLVVVLKGIFSNLTMRSVDGAEKDYQNLSGIVADQQEFCAPDGEYVVFGIYSEDDQVSKDDTFAGLHMHAVRTDGSFGGHVHKFSGFSGRAQVMGVELERWLVTHAANDNKPAYRRALKPGESLDGQIQTFVL